MSLDTCVRCEPFSFINTTYNVAIKHG